jgi:hypothetical protein
LRAGLCDAVVCGGVDTLSPLNNHAALIKAFAPDVQAVDTP